MKIELNDVSLLLLSHGIQALDRANRDPGIKKELKQLKKQISGQRAFINVNVAQAEFVQHILNSCTQEVRSLDMTDRKVLGLTKEEVLDKLAEDIQKLQPGE